MNKKIIKYVILVFLIVFTVVLGVNNYNSGVYADAHQLDGASVGWFTPNGVIIFLVSAILTVAYAIYLFMKATVRSNQR